MGCILELLLSILKLPFRILWFPFSLIFGKSTDNGDGSGGIFGNNDDDSDDGDE